MLKRLNNRLELARRNDQGFTLIELLLVIVILGVLAGIVVFSVGGINDQSKSAACKADVATVQTATEAFYAQSPAKVYPADVAALVTAKLLKGPPTDGTTITINQATGDVTAAPAC